MYLHYNVKSLSKSVILLLKKHTKLKTKSFLNKQDASFIDIDSVTKKLLPSQTRACSMRCENQRNDLIFPKKKSCETVDRLTNFRCLEILTETHDTTCKPRNLV